MVKSPPATAVVDSPSYASTLRIVSLVGEILNPGLNWSGMFVCDYTGGLTSPSLSDLPGCNNVMAMRDRLISFHVHLYVLQ